MYGCTMANLPHLNDLRTQGRLAWAAIERAWTADPREVVDALAGAGFHEYRHEVTQSRRDRTPTGGVWQGLDSRTGAVASAIWVRRHDAPPLVFIDIDGEPLEDEAR
jgi:hypothetical protein